MEVEFETDKYLSGTKTRGIQMRKKNLGGHKQKGERRPTLVTRGRGPPARRRSQKKRGVRKSYTENKVVEKQNPFGQRYDATILSRKELRSRRGSPRGRQASREGEKTTLGGLGSAGSEYGNGGGVAIPRRRGAI